MSHTDNNNEAAAAKLTEENKRLSAEVESLKKENEALRSGRTKLEKMLESIGEGVIAVGCDLAVIFANNAAASICGFDIRGAIGRPISSALRLINSASREPAPNPVEKTLQTRQTVGLEHNSIIVTPAGEEKFLSASSAPIFDGGGALSGAILVFRDISDRRKMEEELLKVSKLESLGVLAGGIAHDFNNLLTGITGNISYAKFIIDDESPAQEALNTAEEIAFKAKDLTAQFRTFSKGGAPVKKIVFLSETLRPAVEFSLRGTKVRASYDIDAALWPAEIDEGQISQLVANISINAAQAMPDGGRLFVRASNETAAAGNPMNLPAGKYLRISFRDEGHGIPQENIAKIFDPYFSTRRAGDGLGLTASYSIARKHGGIITVESAHGMGAVFSVLLPALPEAGASSCLSPGPGISAAGKGRKILVMDDESIVREVTANLLKHLGYEVRTVKNGSEAIAAYMEAGKDLKPFDAMILDLFVPGDLGGPEVVKTLAGAGEKVKAIAASGFSNETIMAKYRDYGFCAVVSKPYKIKELDELLQSVIGK
jgi:PAS domain S-box-containing protein